MGQAKLRGTFEQRAAAAIAKQPVTTGLDILNCGAGDLEIRFTKDDPIEIERASRIITDMLRRGYSLFVPGDDGRLVRVQKFDPKQMTYTIACGPTEPVPEKLEEYESIETSFKAAEKKKRGRPAKSKTVHMASTKATCVGRTAGG